MDTQTVIAALDATEIDEAYLPEFVTMLIEAYGGLEDQSDFDGFRERLNDQTDFADECERFLQYAEDTDRMDLVRDLAELGPDQVKAEWDQARAAQAVEGEQAGAEPPSRQEFAAALQTYNGYWDRTEEGWPAFVAAFQEYAEGAFGQVAVEFFQRADGEDKRALFTEYGIPIPEPAPEPAPEVNELAQAGARFGYLWADFDGTRESWAQCRDWTYGAANDADPALYAVLYQQFQDLEAKPMPDRVVQLNDWGFALTATGQEDEDAAYGAMAEMLDEEKIAATSALLTKSATEVLPDEAAAVITEAFRDVVEDMSWAADLSQPEIDKVLASVARDLQGTTA